jgi:hypothetical protein
MCILCGELTAYQTLPSERVNALLFIHINSRSLLGSSDKPTFDGGFEWQAPRDETKEIEQLTRLMSQLDVDYEEDEICKLFLLTLF